MANLFQERIQVAIEHNPWHNELGIPDGIHTIGEFISAVLAVDNEQDARLFYDGYIEYQKRFNDDTTAERNARSDIGWCFGEGMKPERIQMWVKVCGASHPVFGDTLPSPDKAFKMGLERGERT